MVAVGSADVAAQLALAGYQAPAIGLGVVAVVFAIFLGYGLRRVQRLDKFEKELKG